MPNVNNRFTEQQLDGAVESLRKCLRDLTKVVDRPTALASRERCRNWIDQAVKVFRELHEEYDTTLGEIHDLKAELEEERDGHKRYVQLVEKIHDCRMGVISFDELVEARK